jgi:predicted AlkP superfamily phosphohydrolase/phosphomutase
VTRSALFILDAAEGSFVRELAEAGELPAIAGMLERGTWCPLTTSVAYRAEYACTELLTGMTAEMNRYWSTVVFDPQTYACGTVGSARREPFYAEPDATVVAFDVPHSVAVDGLRGAQVVGWGGHDARFQHPRVSCPRGLMAEIDARFGPDPSVEVEFTGSWHQAWYIHALADALIASARRRTDIALWLLEREPDWDLLLMGVSELHSAGHSLAHGLDPTHLLGSHATAAPARARLVDVYRAVDDTIGRVAASLPEDTIVGLVSPKGMEPSRDDLPSGILLPELLYRLSTGRPFLHEPTHRSWRRRGYPVMAPEPDEYSTARLDWLQAESRRAELKRWMHATAPAAHTALRTIRHNQLLRRVFGKRPGRPSSSELAEATGSLAVPVVMPPDGTEPTLAGEVEWQQAMLYRRHWPTMPWFALPTYSQGHIRLNLIGRETQGLIRPEDYERTCDQLENSLRQVTDPRTGQPVVAEVLRLRADDPTAIDGPGADLAVTWRTPVDAFQHPVAGTIGPFAFPRSGSHTSNGFLLIAAPGLPPHTDLGVHEVLDVAPTMRALLGWPARSRLEGTTITQLVPPFPAPRHHN